MSLNIHRPYPGVALIATERGSVLVGAPADAFKATKYYCQEYDIPFPRVLVAPPTLLAEAHPQFNPEFFLYDFLFVYGAAFKPELAGERLLFVLDESNVEDQKQSLRITLNGPTRQEMAGYVGADGKKVLDKATVDRLANVGEHMAIKKDGTARQVDDMIETIVFDREGRASVLDDLLTFERNGPNGYIVRSGGDAEKIDLSFTPPVVPFATLPIPAHPETPMRFGVKPLGTRSGFDLSGPTTGFVIWVNGQAIIYDGPVGTRYLLEHQGISTEDIAAVVLSHCHEDHMGAFVDLILAGARPKVYTAEPIYQSALVKLAGYFEQPVSEVAGFLDYHRITPGEPLDMFGAKFEFFYTVHAIPTIGLRVSMKSVGGTEHSLQISGDTMHHEGLDDLKKAGILSKETHKEMRNLIPRKKVADALYFSDVGESIIHGHPKDWKDNPNDVRYYHCPDNEHTRSFGHELAVPGHSVSLIKASTLHPATPARLLSALRFLKISDPGWFATILFHGYSRTVEPGDILAAKGKRGDDAFTVIVSGTASVSTKKGDTVTLLRAGEFFGAVELVNKKGRYTATVKAETPMELFAIDAKLFHDYITETGLDDVVRHVWELRPKVESAKIFRTLDLAVRNRIARVATEESYKRGDHIIEAGTVGDDFFVMFEGTVDVESDGHVLTTIHADAPDNFFGEMEAIYPNRPRTASVVATSTVRLLRIRGQQIRDLFEDDMRVRYGLLVAIQKRSA